MKDLNDNNISENTVSVRLNKFMSEAGFCSRREADRLIEAGEVTVDGVPAVAGQKVLPGQKVICGGNVIQKNNKMVLIAFNKPEGVECTSAKDVSNNIINFIDHPQRIYPIGRLDKSSSGLILLTNNGDLVNKILKSSGRHEKEYSVTVNKPITGEFLERMRSGVDLKYDEVYRERIKNGRPAHPGETVRTLPCKVRTTGKTTFDIILTQGMNRQIRRMCSTLGYKVITLKRTRIMNIRLGNLPEGHWRNVTEAEINKLMKELAKGKD